MSGQIFNFEEGLQEGNILKSKSDTNVLNKKQQSGFSDLKQYQITLEHLSGFYDLVNYLSHQIYSAANIKIDKNIIYLDAIASQDFFIGMPFKDKTYIRKNDKREIVDFEHNPFITCKYDFIHFIDWEYACIGQNHVYLIANNKDTNSVTYRNLKYFTLAIYCDMEDKLDVFREKDRLDFRTIKFSVQSDVDEDGNIHETADMIVEHRYVEKSIKSFVLTEKNKDLIHYYNKKHLEEEHRNFQEFIKYGNSGAANGSEIDRKMSYINLKYNGLYNYYKIDTENKFKRNYEQEDEEDES